jgi:hypothetical protein
VGTGTILVDQSPYVRALRLGSDTTVDGLTFRGNGTATLIVGGLTGGQQGVAITSYSTHNVKVRNCHFYDFVQGVINTGASLIQFSSGYAFEVSGCYFDVSNDGFVDIGCAYRVGDTIITENVSYSNSDIFYHCSSVGATEKVGTSQVEVTAHHIVTDNILIKNRWEPVAAGRAPGRHGITVHYDGGTSHLTATGNVIGNTTRHGFYLRGLNDGTSTNPAGPNTIANNRLLYCGTGLSDTSNYNSGIRVENTVGTIITGNHIEKSGYKPDGTDGLMNGLDIECVRGTQDTVIAENTLVGARKGSINIEMSVGDRKIKNVRIVNNTIKNSTYGVNIQSPGLATTEVADVKILDNHIELTGATHRTHGTACGILTEISPISALTKYSLQITGNTVVGLGKTSSQYGIAMSFGANDFTSTSLVSDNILRGLEYGLASFRFFTNQTDYLPHRALGTTVRWERNRIVSCGNALFTQVNANGRLNLVEDNNIYEDCTAVTISQTLNSWHVAYEGRCTGRDSSGNLLVEFKADGIPNGVGAAEQYYQGDRIINPAPSLGGQRGWVCTASGTPGTWATFGTIVGITALANDATPTVAGGSTFTTGGTTTITDFDDGDLGQTITVLSEHAVTITDGTNIILHGSANFVMAAADSLTLVLKADNKWYETARMVN